MSVSGSLKGGPKRSWPENVENVQMFPFADFVWLSCQYLCNRSQDSLLARALAS